MPGASVVLFNWVGAALERRWPAAAPLRALTALPVVLAGIDFTEDAFQVC